MKTNNFFRWIMLFYTAILVVCVLSACGQPRQQMDKGPLLGDWKRGGFTYNPGIQPDQAKAHWPAPTQTYPATNVEHLLITETSITDVDTNNSVYLQHVYNNYDYYNDSLLLYDSQGISYLYKIAWVRNDTMLTYYSGQYLYYYKQ